MTEPIEFSTPRRFLPQWRDGDREPPAAVNADPQVMRGLSVPCRAELPFMPCVEIGWRLTRESWGQGYARGAPHVRLGRLFNVVTP